MTRFSMTTSLVVTVIFTVASVLSLAAAQVDDRARALLEGLLTDTAQEIESIDQSMVTTTYLPDGTTQVSHSRIVIDFKNRRLITFTEMGEGMPSTIMAYQNGEVTMTMSGMPEALPVPPGVAESLEAAFEQQTSFVLKESDKATYDGLVDYEVLKGEQVTYTTTLPGQTEPITASYLFQDGKLAGTYTIAEGLEVVSVYDEPVSSYASGLIDNTLYILQDGAWSKTSHIQFGDIKINEPIDESLFD